MAGQGLQKYSVLEVPRCLDRGIFFKYLESESRFEDIDVSETIVFFSSTRVHSQEDSCMILKAAKAFSLENDINMAK